MAKKQQPIFSTYWYFKKFDRIVFLFLGAIFVLFIPSYNQYINDVMSMPRVALKEIEKPADAAPYPTNTTGVYPGSEITAQGVVILDSASGVYLYKRNEEELLAPASTTKILTALVALDYFALDDVITVGNMVHNGQLMELVPGERITVENLLYGALIQSGNDAAWTLAEGYPGGVDGFVKAMNEKAKKLGLKKSSFTNPVGYDDPNHKMSPLDLARLGSIALTNKTIAKMVAIPQITVSDTTHTYFHSLKNVNQLLGKIPGVGGIKTGWTEEAGENLITMVERNGHTVIIVVLKSQDRFGETSKLIDWVFSSIRWDTYSDAHIQ